MVNKWTLFFVSVEIASVFSIALGMYLLTRYRVVQERFSNSVYAPYAYLIAPGTVSKQARGALIHFDFQKKQLPHNYLEVKLKPIGPYSWKTFILKPGYTLYLALLPDLEGEIDDSTNLDYLRYDVPVLVNDTGEIVK